MKNKIIVETIFAVLSFVGIVVVAILCLTNFIVTGEVDVSMSALFFAFVANFKVAEIKIHLN